ncbi:hypothetical protein GYMLUDRAFT_217036 [Collybiopsis luxurians FD-317 M1]|nr:hypothetical protein GYMLUDRAFT_217036 [Collybiopsis luxurians FD-317 M1]
MGASILFSLAKVVCVLLATIGLQITATPPHPPPAKSDEAPSTSWEILICWLAASIEILLVSSYTFGYDTLAESILEALGMHVHRPLRVEKPVLPDLSPSDWISNSSSVYLYPAPIFLVGTTLAVLGGCIRYLCYRELGRLFTFEMSIMKEHKLITSGPYAFVRHPAYTGVLCTIVGIVFVHGASGSWLRECRALNTPFGLAMSITYFLITGLITVGLLKRIPKEDQALEERFGQEWRNWAERVPYQLFWGVY